ncbi:pentatricopeptide repeat-containing protein At4g02750-like [Selaginella moellendorffii]|uniref:pentatricopeptide repeat-containing protein At4g02750-like n=1 Tax=Selaginella moellendorffii TaxID=88036 RepID=UPI000D1C45AF|nr:pentatricopeptide repeat-containing protein At4g02750-like [Selaginella moellendorffii]|eukprot:XP_024536585.1 pentatricopeptide repeat-containing protein At4g02750-like [Selaginella moellendorffii]
MQFQPSIGLQWKETKHGDGDGDGEIALLAARLRSCRDAGDLSQCRAIHAEILESSFHRNKFLRNLLVEAYGSCGSVPSARLVFDSIDRPNLFSWNILIKVYAGNGFPREALEIYARMQRDGTLQLNAHTYATVLGVCWDLELGREIHSKILEAGHESNEVVANGLITMYARCGSVEESRAVFDKIRDPNVVSWTSMITAYSQNGHLEEAKELLDRMPEPKTYACNVLIAALCKRGFMDRAKDIFDSLPDPDVVSRTSMLVAYARSGHLYEARQVFDDMNERNVVSWNAMITGYTQTGFLREAWYLFQKMPIKDTVSWTTMLTAYAQSKNLRAAKELFDKMGTKDLVSWNAMLGAYSHSGVVVEAKDLFDQIPEKDTVSWNTLLGAYALHGHVSQAEALFAEIPCPNPISWNTMLTSYAFNDRLQDAELMFERMRDKNAVSWNILIAAFAEKGQAKKAIALVVRKDLEGYPTDKYTLIGIFDACTSLGVAEDGKAVHMSVVEAGILFDDAVGESLINMYAKCGSLDDARALFDKSSKNSVDIAAWNSFMAACSTAGSGAEALEIFQTLDQHGLEPDHISFVRILSACSHAGMIEHARSYFSSIPGDYHSGVTMDHYLCMVDMLGRSGRLKQARELLDSMPFEPDVIAWMTLLSACSNHGDTTGGIVSARRIIELEPQTSGPFILLSNIYKQLGGTRKSAF